MMNSSFHFLFAIVTIIISTTTGFSNGLDDGEFEFIGETGSPVTVKEGKRDLTLECSVSSSQDLIFEWTFDDILIQKDPRRTQIGSNLHISRVLRKYDTGIFRCIATNSTSGYSRTSPPIRINVIWLSESASVNISVPGKGESITQGQEVTLECRVEGTLEITFAWFRNGEMLDEITNRRIFHGRRLHLTPVTSEDNGSYSCQATSDAGTVQSTENFHLIVEDDDVPKILIPPQNQVAEKNSIVRFDCVFGNGAPVEWLFNEDLIQNSTRWNILTNGSLLIGRATEAEIGIYKCLTHLTSNAAKHTQIYSATLRISNLESLNPNSLLPKPFGSSHELGYPPMATTEVYCAKPRGVPPPKIWWEDPKGKPISNLQEQRIHVRDEDTLVLTNIREEDAGKYTCVVENMSGSSTIFFNLALTNEPRIINHPSGQVKEEGESVTFTCQFSSSPFPLTRIQWIHNHQPIRHAHPSVKHHHRIRNIELNGTLVISTVQINDRGNYACEITTQGYPPVTSQAATLIVIEKLKFLSTPVDRRLELGSTYRIPCKAQGAPPPTVNWMKVGHQNYQWPKHIQEENGALLFQEIQKTDHGEYACVAANAQGVINTTIKIDVHASPRFTVTPQNPTEAFEGESVTMHCEAEGDPIPTIKWDKDTNTSIDNERFLVLGNGSLVIREVSREDHNHRFGCTAGNSGGFKREEVQLIVREFNEFLSTEKNGVMTRTVWITLSVAAGYMLLVIGLMLWCRYKQLKRKQTYLADIRGEIGETELKDGLLPVSNGIAKHQKPESCRESVKSDGETGKSTHSSVTRGGSAPASVASHRSQVSVHSKRSVCTNYDEISGGRKDLQFVLLLGHGAYGEVFLAKGKVNSEEKLLMVKALQTKEEFALSEFKREIDMFYKLDHENVAALVRLSREMDPHYMVMEYSDWGDLKQFLLATRKEHPKTPKPPPLSNAQIIQIIKQVALGMDHLANQRFVHRDLATRNCLISSGLRVQISNPCLSRDTYSNEYFNYKNRVVPLRWLSHEALVDDDYSTKSDVWSFAWLIWEISNQAAIPLPHLKDEEVAGFLERKDFQRGNMDAVPESIRVILSECWDSCPSKRPTFSSIIVSLQEITQ